MNAETIARVLSGKRSGKGWLVLCPAHDDHDPSLSITDGENGKLRVKCWAGCTGRDVLAELRKRGLLSGAIAGHRHHQQALNAKTDNKHDANRTEKAMQLWQASKSTKNTPVVPYLQKRGIILPPPLTLQYHPALKHPGGGYLPGMVALVQRGIDGESIGILRTFLARDGSGKAAVSPDRMMLGLCSGGAVRLAPAENVLMIGEGIETCLAAMQATNLPTWAALSTSGMRSLDLPSDVHEVIVLADGDDPGEQAARAAARRWVREGRKVRIARPPRGMDFNDVLLGRMVEGVA